MKHLVLVLLVGLGTGLPSRARLSRASEQEGSMKGVHLVTLDPGHFHAALVQKEMYPDVSKRVDVYAPLGADLVDHLNRVARFNERKDHPTSWELEVHAGPDSLARMLRERPGNVVVLSGRNQGKIDRIQACIGAGLNALVDKPWIIDAQDLGKLGAALDEAEKKRLIAYDIMTERFEITSILQRELVKDPEITGGILSGTKDSPSVLMESVHHLMKIVAGVPNLRPAWFFDTHQQGEGLADVGTHLADLVQWTLSSETPIDYRADVRVLAAQRWPTLITKANFQRVTGEADFPDFLQANVRDGSLDYYCNTQVSYMLKGIHVKLSALWNWEPPAGSGDTHFAVYKGERSSVEVRQGKKENYRPELYVVPKSDGARILTALKRKITSLQERYPGIAVEELPGEIHIGVPASLRTGHEEHFAQVTQLFLGYLREGKPLPAWEKANMLAKYYLTTKGVELSHQAPPTPARRLAP